MDNSVSIWSKYTSMEFYYNGANSFISHELHLEGGGIILYPLRPIILHRWGSWDLYLALVDKIDRKRYPKYAQISG